MSCRKNFFLMLLCMSLFSSCCALTTAKGQNVSQSEVLPFPDAGQTIEKEIAGGKSHSYRLTLFAGQYLNLSIEQHGIDVVVILFGPDNKKLIEVDSPNGTQGTENLVWVIEQSGQHRLEIRSLEEGAGSGRYIAKLVELRRATNNDRALTEAAQLIAESLNLYARGEFRPAIPLATRALSLQENALPADNDIIITSINTLAMLYYAAGEYAHAVPLFQRALIIVERKRGPEHPETAVSLNNLAELFRIQGEYEQAEPLYQRALAIQEKSSDKNDINISAMVNNLALLYQAKGDLTRAEPFFRRALSMREKQYGEMHAETAQSLNNLAELYRLHSHFDQAEPLFLRALAVWEKVAGKEHPETANTANNLGLLYQEKGDFKKALMMLRQALEVWEKKLGPEHNLTITSLNNLASLYTEQGEYAEAETLHRKALAISEKKFGTEHKLISLSYNYLGNIYFRKNEFAQAETFYRQALTIQEKLLGESDPDTATILNNLGLLYFQQSKFRQAKECLHRSLAAIEKIFGADHVRTATALNNLARLYEVAGEVPEAIVLRARAQVIEEHQIALNLTSGSERQKLAYIATLTAQTDYSVDLHIRSAPRNATARDLAFVAILQRKGRVLDAMNDGLEAIQKRAAPEDRALISQLKTQRALLSQTVFRGPGKNSAAEYQRTIRQLEDGIEKLEEEIGKRSAAYRALSQPVTLAAIQSAIPSRGALVEFYSYRRLSFPTVNAEDRYGSPRYVAYVLHPQGEAEWVDLGEIQPIDAAIGEFRKTLQNPRRADLNRQSRRVERLVMQPLYKLLGKAHQVFISPDGALNLIPFAALMDRQNRYLAQRYSFQYLTSGRDLLRLRSRSQAASLPVIVANPDFGEKPADRKEVAKPGLLDLSQAYFSPLKATAEEARALTTLLPKAMTLTGTQATETALKQVVGPSILHIATHGFFLADHPVEDTIVEQRRKLLQQTGTVPLGAEFANPLLRSGLGLAGANLRKSGEDDGILTALEVAGLDLTGTKLVVLSACETGVGEVRTGEGVYGLRRALVLAGAETQVMSLWPVSDRATRDLMIGYYKRLQAGEGRSEAMRKVQLQMLKDPRRRHPFYWASFIVSGEWTSLGEKKIIFLLAD